MSFTVCPRSLDQFYVVNKLLYEIGQDFLDIAFYISLVMTFWTYGTIKVLSRPIRQKAQEF